ncbi:hypothetical protein Thein_0966 [Thermodesulfatator indicus DSM 15286]|uniref:Uncharacterized protein n=1 Tax=Thermodesulfatator indicus (strain DSM 15286 / JCM 11887 / CIR29812) TaxID=667014 RepID=F8ADA0_THEID|nr:hypothetical protein [Thermodesulfatator indicus]AEH44838.1 hypothetical protein Thein_0966 [Thermodesulfatator indicus DSM 15286]
MPEGSCLKLEAVYNAYVRNCFAHGSCNAIACCHCSRVNNVILIERLTWKIEEKNAIKTGIDKNRSKFKKY